MSQNFYITTAIDYVNAAPHLGHAYEKIATDVVSRFQKLLGKEVFFLTGTDEHGTKVEKTAKGKGMEPKAYTDLISQEFTKAWKYLNLDYDRFIRTTDTDHYAVVAHLWRTLLAKGDIYKASYTGLYCSGCENFVTERDLTEAGECPNHRTKPEPVQEENYFFKLTAYKDKLMELAKSGTFIKPDFRAAEVLKMLEDLEDISVSRSRTSVSWGIPVPDDPDQVIYVWIDALSNYITGIGYQHDQSLFNKFWPADIHMIGKDILRFHAVYWPAMLMSAGIPVPKCVYAHGFININDAKISKSIGNVVAPIALGEAFNLPNSDPIRYYLMTVTTFGQDGNFTEDDFKTKVNADLANNLGNLLNRTLNMTNKYFDGKVPVQVGQASVDIVKTATGTKISFVPNDEEIDQIKTAYQNLEFHKAAELIFYRVDRANRLINDAEPWTLFKEERIEDLGRVMYTVLDQLRQTAILLYPITPVLCQEIWQQLGYTSQVGEQSSWNDVAKTSLPAGQETRLAGPILPRLDSELAGDAKKVGAKG